jgi:chromosome segregation ATPase
LEIVQLEQEQLLGETSDIDDEMTKYNRALSTVSTDINSAQNIVAETSEKISAVSAQMEDFNQSVVDLKLKLTALHARLENSDSSLKRLKEFHDDSLTRLDQLYREITLKKQKEEAARLGVSDNEKSCHKCTAPSKAWTMPSASARQVTRKSMPGSRKATAK